MVVLHILVRCRFGTLDFSHFLQNEIFFLIFKLRNSGKKTLNKFPVFSLLYNHPSSSKSHFSTNLNFLVWYKSLWQQLQLVQKKFTIQCISFCQIIRAISKSIANCQTFCAQVKLVFFIFLNIGQNPSKKDVTSETLERNAKPKKLIVHLMIWAG